MRKKIIHICVYAFIVLLMLYFIVLPVIKWNISYDLSSVTDGKKAVEFYLNAIDEKNPKKASMIYPSLNEGDSRPSIYEFSCVEYCNIDKIEEVDDTENLLSSGEKMIKADFEWRFAFGNPPEIFSSFNDGNYTLYFRVAKNKDVGNWYIVASYPLV